MNTPRPTAAPTRRVPPSGCPRAPTPRPSGAEAACWSIHLRGRTWCGVFSRRLLYGPEEIARLSTAYEQAWRTIGVKDRNDPLTELIAKKIIEIGQTGVKDRDQICSRAVEALDLPEG